MVLVQYAYCFVQKAVMTIVIFRNDNCTSFSVFQSIDNQSVYLLSVVGEIQKELFITLKTFILKVLSFILYSCFNL